MGTTEAVEAGIVSANQKVKSGTSGGPVVTKDGELFGMYLRQASDPMPIGGSGPALLTAKVAAEVGARPDRCELSIHGCPVFSRHQAVPSDSPLDEPPDRCRLRLGIEPL